MNILILTQYYPPETGACANRMAGFARQLAHAGHAVTVVTGFPNYPWGTIYPGYRRVWCMQDRDSDVRLIRTWLAIRAPRHPWDRFVNYGGFFISSMYGALRHGGAPDVVMATSGPILVGLAGALVALAKRRPFILDVRDIWPERIVVAGEFTNPVAIKILEWVERFLYTRAVRIVCVTQGLQSRLAAKGVALQKMTVITNGVDTDVFQQGQAEPPGLPPRQTLLKPFWVIYAGTLGLLQDHHLILETAERLTSYPEIQFALVGEGVRRSYLEAEIRRRQLPNVALLGNRPQRELAAMLHAAHIGINANTAHAHNAMAIPVKMFDYMASGLPVVLANQGEVETLVQEGGFGMCVPPGDVEQFTAAILRLYQDPILRQEMGQRGRDLVHQRFSFARLTRDLEHLLTPFGG